MPSRPGMGRWVRASEIISYDGWCVPHKTGPPPSLDLSAHSGGGHLPEQPLNPPDSVDVAGPFPVERLAVAGGWLAASVHRNRYNPLHMNWSFGVGFLPLEVGGQSYDTGLSIEIETRDIRRIEQFVGLA